MMTGGLLWQCIGGHLPGCGGGGGLGVSKLAVSKLAVM